MCTVLSSFQTKVFSSFRYVLYLYFMVYNQVVLSGSRAILQSKWRLVLSDLSDSSLTLIKKLGTIYAVKSTLFKTKIKYKR